MTNEQACTLCGQVRLELILKQDPWTLHRCLTCGFVFKLGAVFDYEGLPREYYIKYNFDRSNEVKEVVRILHKQYPSLRGLTMLEVGSGTGSLLNEFKKYGLNVYGIEPSKSAVAIAESVFGLSSISTGYFAADTLSVKPDVFLLYDVIEHLDDASDLFQEFRQSMTMNSVLVVKSGNPSSLNALLYPSKWEYFLMDEHVAFYSEKALNVLCDKTGLRVVKFSRFEDAYGGLKSRLLFKNIIKAFLLHLFPKNSRVSNRLSIYLANDHFIALIRRAN